MKTKKLALLLSAFGVLALGAGASADVQITEWMYDGTSKGEFIEIANVGTIAVDLNGWSFDDDSRAPGTVSLSSFGILNPGQCAIIAEATADAFRTMWGASTNNLRILGGNTTNLGRADEINIFDSNNNLIDRLTYNDQVGNGPRTSGKSASIPAADYGLQTASAGWILSSVGDRFHSWSSSVGHIGNPGIVPEPGTIAALAGGLLGLLGIRRRAK